MTKPKPKVAPKSLTQFVRDKKRRTCRVCALPDAIREELREARNKKITRAVAIEWLKSEHGITVTASEFDTHHSARHEQGE